MLIHSLKTLNIDYKLFIGDILDVKKCYKIMEIFGMKIGIAVETFYIFILV